MLRDPFVREKFTREQSFARKLAQEYFERFSKDRYQTEVENWRNLQSANIEFTMKRLRDPIACLKNVPTVRATPFPASTTEKWQPTNDRYRLNIRKRGKLPGANWSARTRTSDDPAPACAYPNAGLCDPD